MTRWRSACRSSIADGIEEILAEPRRRWRPSTGLPGACASRTSRSASMTVAPQARKSSATVDLPEAMLPVRATLSIGRGAPGWLR